MDFHANSSSANDGHPPTNQAPLLPAEDGPQEEGSQSKTSVVSIKPELEEKESRLSNGLKFFLSWGIGVFGVAAAIVFGIWAPISYKATIQGNRNSDSAQSSMISAFSQANAYATALNDVQYSAAAQASSMLEVQSAMDDTLSAMNRRLKAMGQLSLIELCLRNKVSGNCNRRMKHFFR
jgi:hypothetical protein